MKLTKKALCLLFALVLCLQCVACSGESKKAEPEITAIYLSQNSIEMKADESYQLQYTVMPETVTGYTLTWKSTDTTIATVDSMGLIKAVAPGTTRVICSTTDGVTDVCEVTVKEPSAIEQLNENEKEFYDYLIESWMDGAYNASAIRVKKLYYSGESGKKTFSSTFSFIVQMEGTNKAGGTINKMYGFLKLSDSIIFMPLSSSQDLSCPMETTVMDPAKINAALEEYWESQHR